MRPSPLSLRVLVLWTSHWQGYHAVQLLRFLPRDLRPLLALCRLFLLMAALYRRTGLSGMRTMACFICRTLQRHLLQHAPPGHDVSIVGAPAAGVHLQIRSGHVLTVDYVLRPPPVLRVPAGSDGDAVAVPLSGTGPGTPAEVPTIQAKLLPAEGHTNGTDARPALPHRAVFLVNLPLGTFPNCWRLCYSLAILSRRRSL